MFDLGGSTRQRVSRLEDGMADLRNDVGGLGSKIDRLVEGLTSTDEKAASQARTVKNEMQQETDRKSKERTSLLSLGIGALGAIALIVAALTGPWKEKLETTATGQIADTAAISAVREVLAQQGAAIGRNGDSIDLAREKNRLQDSEIRDHDRSVAALKQALVDRGIPVAAP